LGLSFADNWPEYFKLAGTTIFRSTDVEQMDRTTYDFLNYLGDIGGLQGILISICSVLVPYYSSFMANCFFISKLYVQNKVSNLKKPSGVSSKMIADFKNRTPIKNPDLIMLLFGCCFNRKKHKEFWNLHNQGRK